MYAITCIHCVSNIDQAIHRFRYICYMFSIEKESRAVAYYRKNQSQYSIVFFGHFELFLILFFKYKTLCITEEPSKKQLIHDDCLESLRRLFPPVTIFLDLFLCAGYFFNAFD